ncbi:unnamed protein product, partial [Gordionus sp. m RMFG-2023]
YNSKTNTTNNDFIFVLNDLIIIYCKVNKTIIITHTQFWESFKVGKLQKDIYSHYHILKLLPSPSNDIHTITLNVKNRESSSIQVLLWGNENVFYTNIPFIQEIRDFYLRQDDQAYISERACELKPIGDVHKDTLNYTLKNIFSNDENKQYIVKCDWLNFYNHSFVCKLTKQNIFCIYSLNYPNFPIYFCNIMNINFVDNIGDPNNSISETSTHISSLKISEALGETYIDFVVGPDLITTDVENNSSYTLLFMKADGTILSLYLYLPYAYAGLDSFGNTFTKKNVSNIFYSHFYNLDITPTGKEIDDINLEYHSMIYLPSISPNILVLCQVDFELSSNVNGNIQDENSSYSEDHYNCIFKHCALIPSLNKNHSRDPPLSESLITYHAYIFDTVKTFIQPSIKLFPFCHNNNSHSNISPLYPVGYLVIQPSCGISMFHFPWITKIQQLNSMFSLNSGKLFQDKNAARDERLYLIAKEVSKSSSLEILIDFKSNCKNEHNFLNGFDINFVPLAGNFSKDTKNTMVEIYILDSNSCLKQHTFDAGEYMNKDNSTFLQSLATHLEDQNELSLIVKDQLMNTEQFQNHTMLFGKGKNGRLDVTKLNQALDDLLVKKKDLYHVMASQQTKRDEISKAMEALRAKLLKSQERWTFLQAKIGSFKARVTVVFRKIEFFGPSADDKDTVINTHEIKRTLQQLSYKMNYLLFPLVNKLQDMDVKLEMANLQLGLACNKQEKGNEKKDKTKMSKNVGSAYSPQNVEIFRGMVEEQNERINALLNRMRKLGT